MISLSDTDAILTRLRAFRARDLGEKWSALRQAAVVVPLLLDAEEPALLFTLRGRELRHHKGQVCFPGGRRDDLDRDLWDTARREFCEELGFPVERIELIGRLDETPVLLEHRLTPFVARILPPYAYQPSPAEIEAVFRVPLSRFLDPTIHRVERRELLGQSVPIHTFDVWKEPVWGATGRVVAQFLHVALGYRVEGLVIPEELEGGA